MIKSTFVDFCRNSSTDANVFDCFSCNRDFVPATITSLNSLVKQTAQLPEIELTKPKKVLGHDTVSCMTSGMVYGFLGMVEGFIDRINDEVQDDCFVVATGGVSHVYKPLTDKIHVADRLHTLKGLYFLGKDL